MITNKTDFFNDLSNQISEPLYLTDKTDELDEEINHNHWVLSATADIISQTTTTDFLEFIQKVKGHYKNQLDKSQLDIDLIFYLWFDEMAGQLSFNFINSNHDKLPFGCKLKHTDRPEEIVDLYLKSKYHEGIPWNELETIETPEQIAEADRLEKELHDNFVLTVYQEKIKKQK
ncbi:MAG: hypothetical protein K0S33_3846 [Bacteroidetes bacterium]|jgi:hypothetical protein|nr:hypothetical protein [Bacteroidota bacterium]